MDSLNYSMENLDLLPLEGSAELQLPTPDQVRACSRERSCSIVKFEHLELVVKYGEKSRVRLEEAQTIRAVGQAYRGVIPVPELFGWRVSGGQNFIYMSLIRGSTLRECWPLLSSLEKTTVRNQLAGIVASLRSKQNSSGRFIGSVSGGPVQDMYFNDNCSRGPFTNVKAFNDCLQLAAIPGFPVSERPPDPYRSLLPDRCGIFFTHGDLNLANIIISATPGICKISAIIDWEQGGWYPEYWEYCKMLLAEPYTHEWRDGGWAATVMKCYEEESTAFSEYWMWRSPY